MSPRRRLATDSGYRVAGFTLAASKGKRKAFTLVELLAVIAIIGILVSLLMPAVQSAREQRDAPNVKTI